MKDEPKESNAKEALNKSKKTDLYSKQQIVSSEKYSNRRDLLNVLLEDEKQYTLNQVDSLINSFMKGKVM